MVRLNEIAKKYDLSERDFELIYYSTINTVKKISGSRVNEDLFVKYMFDKLEAYGLQYRDAEKVTNLYLESLLEHQEKKDERLVKKVMAGEEALDAIEEEEGVQTSSNTGIDQAIGRNRKHGYTTQVIDMYDEEEKQ